MYAREQTATEEQAFQAALERATGSLRGRGGIGTLGERTLHAALKYYVSPQEATHEQRVEGFVADILLDGEIIEIQTRGFQSLRRKLEVYLKSYPVTVIFPLAATKWLNWVDPETGEVVKRNKSPKKGCFQDCFRELYRIKDFLPHPGLHLHLMLLDIEDYRHLDGWSHDKKRGSTRFERMPVALREQLLLAGPEDYARLVPPSLGQAFTTADYRLCTKLSQANAGAALNVLAHVGAISPQGKQGRRKLYSRAGGAALAPPGGTNPE